MAITAKKISAEKKALIIQLQKEQHNNAYVEAGARINKKYGKGWRETYAEKQETYDEWWQRKNMDGSFAYNGVTDDF